MPAITFPTAECHRPLAGTELYCLVTEARVGVNNMPAESLRSHAREL